MEDFPPLGVFEQHEWTAYFWLMPIYHNSSSLILAWVRSFLHFELTLGTTLWGLHFELRNRASSSLFTYVFFCMLGSNFECNIFILQWTALGPAGTYDIIKLVIIIFMKEISWGKDISFNNVLWSDRGFPCGLAGKESACNVGKLGLIPGLGRSPGEGKG